MSTCDQIMASLNSLNTKVDGVIDFLNYLDSKIDTINSRTQTINDKVVTVSNNVSSNTTVLNTINNNTSNIDFNIDFGTLPTDVSNLKISLSDFRGSVDTIIPKISTIQNYCDWTYSRLGNVQSTVNSISNNEDINDIKTLVLKFDSILEG